MDDWFTERQTRRIFAFACGLITLYCLVLIVYIPYRLFAAHGAVPSTPTEVGFGILLVVFFALVGLTLTMLGLRVLRGRSPQIHLP